MTDWIDIPKDKNHVTREKEKAQALRKTQWWKNEIAKGICHYCGQTFKPSELTMDHVVPVSRGGKSTKGNIVPCCKECNSKKKYMTPADMIFEKIKNENKK